MIRNHPFIGFSDQQITNEINRANLAAVEALDATEWLLLLHNLTHTGSMLEKDYVGTELIEFDLYNYDENLFGYVSREIGSDHFV